MLFTEVNFNFLVVWSKDSKLEIGIWKQKTGIRIWVPELRLRWDKIQKFKFNIKSKHNFIKSKHNFTQIGSRLRPYLGKIVLLSFQNLFYFHVGHFASSNSLKIVHWLWNVCFWPKSILFPWSFDLRTHFCWTVLRRRYEGQFLSCREWYAHFTVLYLIDSCIGSQFKFMKSLSLAYRSMT